jgi:tetratricopeptide (TPR) repeat protein
MRLILIFILSVFLAIGACSKRTQSFSSAGQPQKGKVLSEREKITYEYNFHNANKEKILGNYENAIAHYAQCIKIDNTRPTPFFELANIYDHLGKKDYALEFSRQAATLDPSNDWFLMMYAEMLQKNGRHDKSLSLFEKLSKKHPDNVDYLLELTNNLLILEKYDEAIKILDIVESKAGVSEELSIQKQRIHLTKGNIEKAILETEKLVLAFPFEARYQGMLAELYQNTGQTERALETFNKILEFDPENPFIYLSLADIYNTMDQTEKAFKYLERAFSSEILDIDTKIKILLSYYMITEKRNDLKDEAFKLSWILVETHPTEAKSYTILGDFLYREQKYEEARETFRKAVSLDKNRFLVWNQLLIVESDLGDYHSMEKESIEALELFPNQPSLYLFNGIANIQLKKYEEAVEILELGIIYIAGNPMLKSQFFSYLGDAYNKLKMFLESDNAYEKSLEADPNNFYVLNNYSYYLSLRNEKLDRAEQMAKKANKLLPNTSSFQDTYAWILFQQKKFDEALVWIEKSLNSGGNGNAVILEHYGDILYQTGKPEKALEIWQKAQSIGTGSHNLELKIKEKRLIE